MGQGTAAKERPSKALLHVGKMGEDEEQEERSDSLLGFEATYIASEETVLLSSYDVVFDTGATVSFFKNPSLLTSIAKSRREIYVKGVQADAIGVTVNQEGTFTDIGKVYYNANAVLGFLRSATVVTCSQSYSSPIFSKIRNRIYCSN